jgi:hypothetical protein
MFIYKNYTLKTNNHNTCNFKLRLQIRQTLAYTQYTFLGAFATLRNATIGFVMCVLPQETFRLPLDVLS